MMDRRSLLQGAAGLSCFLGLQKIALGKSMKKEIFTIKGLGKSFSSKVDDSLRKVHLRDYEGYCLPLLALINEKDQKQFSIEISCWTPDFYAESESIGIIFSGVWKYEVLELIEKKYNYSKVAYVKQPDKNYFGFLYIFNSNNFFVIVDVKYINIEYYNINYKHIVDDFINNFEFDQLEQEGENLQIKKLDINNTILLPTDWEYQDITKTVPKNYDPKKTMTSCYVFQNKRRPGALPNIFLMHYNDDIMNIDYLLDSYKEEISNDYKNEPDFMINYKSQKQKYLYGNEYKYLNAKWNSKKDQNLSMNININFFKADNNYGCNMIYLIGSNAIDFTIKPKADPFFVDAWTVIDVMGTSMQRLLEKSLQNGVSNL